MMKKFSYIIVFLISLFLVNVVAKADIVCEAKNDMKFSFTFYEGTGNLKSISEAEGTKLIDFDEKDYSDSEFKVKSADNCPRFNNDYVLSVMNLAGSPFGFTLSYDPVFQNKTAIYLVNFTDSYYSWIKSKNYVPEADVELFTCEAKNGIDFDLVVNTKGRVYKAIRKSDGRVFEDAAASSPINNKEECPLNSAEVNMSVQFRQKTIREGNSQYTISVEYAIADFTTTYSDRILQLRRDNNWLVCEAKNDMKYSYIFNKNTGKPISRVKDLDALYNGGDSGSISLWDEGNAIVKSESDCPLWDNEIKFSKHRCESSDLDLTWYEALGGVVADALGYDGEDVTCASGLNINFTNHYRARKENDKYPKVEGCSSYKTYDSCRQSTEFSCVWVDRNTGNITTNPQTGYCNTDTLQYVQCGNSFDIPAYLPRIISFVINLLKIATPILLVFISAISLLKAITASKEDEITKAKNTLVKRIGIAALIFFTISITQFVIAKVAEPEETAGVKNCFSCFINNRCEGNKYYKNNINGEYTCFYTDGSGSFKCD